MPWQDWVFSVGNGIFALALLPSVMGKSKPAFSSSLLTASVLAVFVGTFATFSLWLSAAVTTVSASMWLTLAVQKYRIDKRDE